MTEEQTEIRRGLELVDAERRRRVADPKLAVAVDAIKRFQQERLATTYADLHAQPRYSAAVQFFLDELYGPGDFSRRDAEFARIVPGLVKLFPRDVVATVRDVISLHALSEQLDTAMGSALGERSPGDGTYGVVWREVGQPSRRHEQVDLSVRVGRAIQTYTRGVWMRRSLKLMRGPAQVAGLGALHSFLERGFDAFAQMHGADYFLAQISEREHAFASAMFAQSNLPRR
ncbi:MAG: hypothetical protein KGN16_21795 [Burkholderiales bacterium]|nr:hypothetical protein [Burkholderiales bacterium]